LALAGNSALSEVSERVKAPSIAGRKRIPFGSKDDRWNEPGDKRTTITPWCKD
jgi:hypothetical protein